MFFFKSNNFIDSNFKLVIYSMEKKIKFVETLEDDAASKLCKTRVNLNISKIKGQTR